MLLSVHPLHLCSVSLKRSTNATLYEQLRNQIVLGIAAGQLAPAEELPSVRNLAADLGINLHTVNKAYALLCEEGYIVMDRRKGAIIAQPILQKPDFMANLAQRLTLSAAEAKCSNIDEKGFINLCRDCYKSINEKNTKGENHG